MVTLTVDIDDKMVKSLINDAKFDCMLSNDKFSTKELILKYKEFGTVACVIDDDVPLAIGGVSRVHDGLGIAWMVLSKTFLKRPILLVKTCKNFINKSAIDLDLHRVQMDIDKSIIENIRFAKTLGFNYEGTMYKYGPQKQDYYRYVLLRE